MNDQEELSPPPCAHFSFTGSITVMRVEDIGRFVAEITVKCNDCQTPFQFMGLEPGLNYNGATVSLDGLEANLGIHPKGQRPNPLQKLMGYTVKAHN